MFTVAVLLGLCASPTPFSINSLADHSTRSAWEGRVIQDPTEGAAARVNTVLDKVTVYQGQAMVERTFEVRANKVGPQRVIVGPFPVAAESGSFQAKVEDGPAHFLDLEIRPGQGSVFQTEEREGLFQNLEALYVEQDHLRAELRSIEMGEQFLNNLVESVQSGNSVAPRTAEDLKQLNETFQFIRERGQELAVSRIEYDRKSGDLKEKIGKLEKELGIQGTGNDNYQEAWLTLYFDQPGSARLRMVYLAQNAFWKPSYEVRVAPDLTGVTVALVAQVSQRTGEDWNEAKILLSTASPSIGLEPPELPLRLLDVPRPDFENPSVAEVPINDNLTFTTEFTNRNLDVVTQYPLAMRKTVSGNLAPHRFVLRELRLDVKTERYVLPSKNRNGFLRAEIRVGGNEVLPPGTAKIFLGPDFRGETEFGRLVPGEIQTVNLGKDPYLTVDIMKVVDERDDPGLLSSTVHISKVYQAWLRLSPSAPGPVDVVVEEVIPVSGSGEVEIRPIQIQPATLQDEESVRDKNEKGILRWKVRSLMPGAEQLFRWGYLYSFDEDQEPNLLELVPQYDH